MYGEYGYVISPRLCEGHHWRIRALEGSREEPCLTQHCLGNTNSIVLASELSSIGCYIRASRVIAANQVATTRVHSDRRRLRKLIKLPVGNSSRGSYSKLETSEGKAAVPNAGQMDLW